MANLKLISFKLCPFVQRSAITLQEKGAQYEIEFIDLANKPAWFLEISPFGKVPVLKVDDVVLFESAVINEYLDETVEGPRLHPSDPLRRAHNRAWIEFASSLLADQFRMAMADDEAEARKIAADLGTKLGRIEAQLQGPFFNGEQFSLVDSATAPLLQRMAWIEAWVPDLGVTRDRPRIRAWTEALLARPSVQRSTVPEIHELFTQMARKPKGDTQRPSFVGRHA